jgi:hypothetical protein
MVGAPHHARSVRHDPVEASRRIGRSGEASFGWGLAEIRIAALVLLGAAAPAAFDFVVPDPFVKWLCALWLAGVALLMHGLVRRASAEAVVLSIDRRGILDRRLMSKRIAWQEIEAICPVDADRSHVVDIRLRWPKDTLAETRWPVRIGAYCQVAYGVPAVTISMLLLEGNVSEMLTAVARYRPDLLHRTNRSAAFSA